MKDRTEMLKEIAAKLAVAVYADTCDHDEDPDVEATVIVSNYSGSPLSEEELDETMEMVDDLLDNYEEIDIEHHRVRDQWDCDWIAIRLFPKLLEASNYNFADDGDDDDDLWVEMRYLAKLTYYAGQSGVDFSDITKYQYEGLLEYVVPDDWDEDEIYDDDDDDYDYDDDEEDID